VQLRRSGHSSRGDTPDADPAPQVLSAACDSFIDEYLETEVDFLLGDYTPKLLLEAPSDDSRAHPSPENVFSVIVAMKNAIVTLLHLVAHSLPIGFWTAAGAALFRKLTTRLSHAYSRKRFL
jgi:hypothetical protein